MKYALEHTLEPLEFILHEVSSQEYAYVGIEIGEWIQIEEQKTQEVQEDQIEPTLELQQ